MRPSRIALVVFAALVALVVAAAIVLYGLVRLSWFERHAGEWLSEKLDTRVTVGSLAIGYFPAPSLDLGRLVVAAGSDPQAPALAELGRVRVTLPWRTLFGGDLRITSLELAAPRLSLAIAADGRGNWEALAERVAALGGDEPAAWWIGQLEFDEGTIAYADERDGTLFELTGIAATATGLAPASYFPLQLRLAGHGADAVAHASLAGEAMADPGNDQYAARGLALRGWLGGLGLQTGGVELAGTIDALQADLAAGTVQLQGLGFEGLGLRLAGHVQVADLDGDPRATFAFKTEPFAPRALANSLNRPLPETADPSALARAELAVQGEYAAGTLTLGKIEGGFDETSFTGRAVLPDTGPPQAQLEFDRVDLDRYLSPESTAPDTPQATLESLLADLSVLDVQADLRFGEARSSGITARGLRVVIEPSAAGAQP